MGISRKYRYLITHRYSSRWANRYNQINETKLPWPDKVILCDLCAESFPEDPNTVVPILQVSWDDGKTWEDVGTRCTTCTDKTRNNLPDFRIPNVQEEDE